MAADRPAGFSLESGWDAANQLIAQVAGSAASEPAVRRDYGWNDAFEPTTIADRAGARRRMPTTTTAR